jgi:tetratricopeptide (TPR) repeat protein
VSADLDDATAQGVRDRLSALLGPDDGAEVAAAVSHSAGLAVDERILAVTRMEQRELIAEAWRLYLAAIARESPLVAWIEDLHWADPVLLRVIDHLTSGAGSRVLVIATARPEFLGSAHLRPREDRYQIELEPLDRAAAEQLARMAGDTPTDAARGAGNPLFIIELARSHAAADEMPVTIQAAIAARLDELSSSEREVLQHASVAGETFDVRDAALLGDREPAEVAGVLGRVTHLGFVAPVDARYRFHHALVREVAYGRLPVAERMALHARYAAEGVDPSDVEALAHHWWEAVKPPDASWVWEEAAALARMRFQAFRAHLAAGHRLEERNAYEESLEVYLRAVELADQVADVAVAEAAVGRAYARQGRGDEAWQHRLRAVELFAQTEAGAPADLFADTLEIATLNWGYFQHLPDDSEVLRLLDDGERIARSTGDDVSLARLLMERAAFTGEAAGAEEIDRFVASPDALLFGEAAHRMAQVYMWAGRIGRSIELYETVFERLLPAGAIINEPEAMVWYSLAAFNAGDLDRADALADRHLEEAARRSAHTRQHALALNALLLLARGEWEQVSTTTGELAELVDANPDTGFCLLGAAAAGYGAIADLLAGRPLPGGMDAYVARVVPESTLIQASSVMVPRAMADDRAALDAGLEAYAPDLRLWDRQRTWDVCDLMPAIALTIAGRWDELGPPLARLVAFAQNGGRMAEAAAAAVREEAAAAKGGAPPTHQRLRALGYIGISELLHFRPGAS